MARTRADGTPVGSGGITYDAEWGHVCSCSVRVTYDTDGYPLAAIPAPTVHVVRDVAPTESGSYLYACERCGASAWSGC